MDDDGGWEPLGHPYELRCGVYTPMLYGYAAVSTHQSAMKYAAVFHTKALLLYMLRCSRTESYEIRRGVYTKAAGC